MKKTLGSLVLVAAMLAVMVPVAFAQLGDCDNSSFSIQNLGTDTATVTVNFYDENGDAVPLTELNGGQPNPFSLAAGAQFQVVVFQIPALADGRYSVVVDSTEPVAVIANLIGYTNACGAGNWPAFNGSYSGFDAGAADYFLPSVVYGQTPGSWNSLISIQNVTADPIDIDITIKDPRGNPDRGTSWADVPGFASVHLDLEEEGAGLNLVLGLNGSAVINATGAVVVTDNQSNYAGGNGLTQSYNGFDGGTSKWFAPALFNMFPKANGWRSSINVQNIGAANTDITVTFSDAGTPMTFADLAPGASHLFYMPDRVGGTNNFAGVIESTGEPIVVIVNASNGNLKEAQTYSAIAEGAGADSVSFPFIAQNYGPNSGWDTEVRVQNIDTVACTSLTIAYSDDPNTGATGPTYQYTTALQPGESWYQYTPTDSHLPDNWLSGSLSVTCDSGQLLGGIANETNHNNNAANGDWSMSYNGF